MPRVETIAHGCGTLTYNKIDFERGTEKQRMYADNILDKMAIGLHNDILADFVKLYPNYEQMPKNECAAIIDRMFHAALDVVYDITDYAGDWIQKYMHFDPHNN